MQSTLLIFAAVLGVVTSVELPDTKRNLGNIHDKGDGWSHCITENQNLELSSVLHDDDISRDWQVTDQPQNFPHALAWTVENYPLAPGNTANNYAPRRHYSETLSTVVIVPISSHGLGSLLERWIWREISAHYIITSTFNHEHGRGISVDPAPAARGGGGHDSSLANVIKWISPRYSSAQLPCGGSKRDGGGHWGSSSSSHLVIAVQTDGPDGRLSDTQIEILRELIAYNGPSTSTNIRLRHLASLAEVVRKRGGGDSCGGGVPNIDEIRERLCLSSPW